MINTFSKFYYGLEVTSNNKWLDIDEGSGEIQIPLVAGFYTLTELALHIEQLLNEYGTQSYVVSVDRANRKYTIDGDSFNFDLLWDTGTNASNSVGALIGFNVAADDTSSDSYESDNSIGEVYEPQFKLQNYVSESSNKELRYGIRSESASGLVETINFGTDRMFEFSINYATNISQPSSGPIKNNPTGVEDLEAFMLQVIRGAYIEFMPDINDQDTFYKIVISDNMSYKLNEQYSRGLTGYFDTNTLKFRIVEVS